MLAVIEVGGKQYIVKPGDILTVDRLDETLTSHTFSPLLISDDGTTTVGTPTVAGASVVCDVVDHVRGDKVRVFKMKSKKHYHRTRGFRASLTQLKVVSISA